MNRDTVNNNTLTCHVTLFCYCIAFQSVHTTIEQKENQFGFHIQRDSQEKKLRNLFFLGV